MKRVTQPKQNSSRIRSVLALGAIVAIGGYFVLQKKTNVSESKVISQPASATEKNIVNYDLKPKFESPIFKSLSSSDWNEFSVLMRDEKNKIETKLTQVIFFLDSKGLADGNTLPFVESFIHALKSQDISRARDLQLLSRVLGKLNLDKKSQQMVESYYQQKKLLKHKTWKEVTVSWSPMPASTRQEIVELLKPGRDDLTADFIYFLAKVTDENAKAQLMAVARKSAEKFSQSQKNLFEANLSKIPRGLASERHE